MYKYQSIVNSLKQEIAAGRWQAGNAFLGVREVCERFHVSHLTAVKVLKTLEGLRLVRSKRGAGTFVAGGRRLGFLSPAIGLAPFFSLIRNELSELCRSNGIAFDITEVDGLVRSDFPERLMQAAGEMIARMPAGLVYLPSANVTTRVTRASADKAPGAVDRQILDAFDAAGIPVVLVDSGIESPLEDKYDLVGTDNRAIGVKLGRHLADRGCRRIMFVTWKSHSPNIRDRLAGLREAVQSAKGRLSSFELTGASIPDFRRLLKSRQRPEAIVAGSDRIALTVLTILKKLRLDVPGDILLAGVDDIEHSRTAEPALTTVRQPYREIARAACETLLNRIARPKAPVRHITIATTLVARASTQRPTGNAHTIVGRTGRDDGRQTPLTLLPVVGATGRLTCKRNCAKLHNTEKHNMILHKGVRA